MSNLYDNPYRSLVYGVDNKIPLINKKKVVGINFDNAATTPPLKAVVEEVITFSSYYSSIHRGEGYKSRLSTFLYDNSRDIVRSFIGAFNDDIDIIYVQNCTEAINKLAGILSQKHSDAVVISTYMEHHSNDLPWRKNFNIKYVAVDDHGCLILDSLKRLLEESNENVVLVTVTGASNVTGHKNNIYEIASLAHSYGAKILVDGAQLIPHDTFSITSPKENKNIDFVVFSGHKLYAPFGCGVLAGPKEFFTENPPDHVGGGTIDYVSHKKVLWTASPDKEEAGSPNVIGAIALGASLKKLSELSMKNIASYEKTLIKYLTSNIQSIPAVILYGDYRDIDNKVSILPFNIEGLHYNTVARILSYEYGIAVRSGCFCAHPYVQTLLKVPDDVSERLSTSPKSAHPGMVRISFGLYNTIEEINKLLYALEAISKNRTYYLNKYKA